MTSKKRRAARAWMHAERERKDREIGFERARANNEYDRARRELTKYIYVEPDPIRERCFNPVFLNEAPAQPYVNFAIPPQSARLFDRRAEELMYALERVAFRAVRHGWDDGRGRLIVQWWGWEQIR